MGNMGNIKLLPHSRCGREAGAEQRGRMPKVRWEKWGMSQRAWRLAMDLECDHVERRGPQKFWNQGVPRLGLGFQKVERMGW